MSIFIFYGRDAALRRPRTSQRDVPTLKRFYRFRLRHFRAALLAGPPGVVVPEIEHGFAEMFNDVGAIEINVFDQCAAIVAIENHVFVLTRRAATFDHNADRVRWPYRSVRNIRRNEECFAFTNKVIDDAIALTDAHFDVAFQLVKILFRIDEMKIIAGIWTLDHHHEKVATIIEIPIAHRWFELLPVLFDPIFEINGRLDRRRGAARRGLWLRNSLSGDDAAYLRPRGASTSVTLNLIQGGFGVVAAVSPASNVMLHPAFCA
jgi:hypothetical protein